MHCPPQLDSDRRPRVMAGEPVLTDWRTLGARIRRTAMVAASMHLIQAAGGGLENGAVVETPRLFAGG